MEKENELKLYIKTIHSEILMDNGLFDVVCDCQDDIGLCENITLFLSKQELDFAKEKGYINIIV